MWIVCHKPNRYASFKLCVKIVYISIDTMKQLLHNISMQTNEEMKMKEYRKRHEARVKRMNKRFELLIARLK